MTIRKLHSLALAGLALVLLAACGNDEEEARLSTGDGERDTRVE